MKTAKQLQMLLEDPQEVEADLPAGWTMARIGDLAATEPRSLTDGPFGSNLKTNHYTEAGPRVIRLQNIGDGEFLDARAHISPDHCERLRQHEALAEDVLIAMLGENLPRACLVPESLGPAIVKADCARLRVAAPAMSPAFVMYALNAPQTRKFASALVHGVGRPRLGLGLLRELPVPLAPTNEQTRLTEAIDSYLSRLDDAVATLERVQRNLKRYRASVLKASVEGRLVPTEAELARKEGRGYEPANVLLARILEERKARWIEQEAEKRRAKAETKATKAGNPWTRDDDQAALANAQSAAAKKYKEPAPPDTSELPELPEGWCWASVDQLLAVGLANGRSVPTAETGFPVLRLTALGGDFVDVTERKVGRWSRSDALRHLVARGDILVARGNGSIRLVGRAGLVHVHPDEVAFPDTMIRIRLVPTLLDGGYFVSIWNSLSVRRQLERKAKTTAGIFKVNQHDIASVLLPIPPSIEQRRIQSEIQRLGSISEALSRAAERGEARSVRLRQGILKWAFEGKLVDQDPNDEPASVLLERIKAERETAQAAAKVKKKTARKPRKKKSG